jgi:hypothetical protein
LVNTVSAFIGQFLLFFWLRLLPFEWPVCPGSARSGQRRAKALLNRGSPGKGLRHENAF